MKYFGQVTNYTNVNFHSFNQALQYSILKQDTNASYQFLTNSPLVIIFAEFSYFEKNKSRLTKSHCCVCVCLCIPPYRC
jgi:hypothetical protein